MGKEKVLQKNPRAKCIRYGGIFMVLAWDAFFAVGPLLGQGYTADEAWESAARDRTATAPKQVDQAIRSAERYFRNHTGKVHRRR